MKYYKKWYLDEKKKYRIKMLCNWCSSKQLCQEWNNLSPDGLIWNNIELTHEDKDIDYYVIINKPIEGEKYVPEKTIIFQMEPWVYDIKKKWGVKTWDKWAEPDPKKFLHVSTHKKELPRI